MKYFVFNKETDYIRGWMEGCAWNGRGVFKVPGAAEGLFISRLLDSREQGTAWSRLVMGSECAGDSQLPFYFYASDQEELTFRGNRRSIASIAGDKGLASEEKLKAFEPYLKRTALNPRDILLYEAEGRFLWFAVRFLGEGRPGVWDLRIFFPKETWLSYLPGVYLRDRESARFLERFLGIFQSLYQDMEEEIRGYGASLDADGGTQEALSRLAGWLDLENVYLWPADKLRRLLKRVPFLYQRRGTREGLRELIALYTGEEPLIVEHFETAACRQGEKGQCVKRLYGEEGEVTLLVKEEYMAAPREYETLKRLAAQMAPAHISVRLIPLKAFIFLGSHSYLGVNSRLGHYRPLRLDGRSLLPFAAVGGEDREGPYENQ